MACGAVIFFTNGNNLLRDVCCLIVISDYSIQSRVDFVFCFSPVPPLIQLNTGGHAVE